MNIFRKQSQSPSLEESRNDRESVIASIRSSRPSAQRSALDTRPPSALRRPDTGIGIDHLLTAYDDYPNVVQDLATTASKLQVAEERSAELEANLKKEKEEREADAQTAVNERVLAAKAAEEEKTNAETSVEKRVREELEPQIVELERKLKEVSAARDGLDKELSNRRREMTGWIAKMERSSKERSEIEIRQKKADEDKLKVDQTLRDLDQEILQALRVSAREIGDDRSPSKGSHPHASRPYCRLPATPALQHASPSMISSRHLSATPYTNTSYGGVLGNPPVSISSGVYNSTGGYFCVTSLLTQLSAYFGVTPTLPFIEGAVAGTNVTALGLAESTQTNILCNPCIFAAIDIVEEVYPSAGMVPVSYLASYVGATAPNVTVNTFVNSTCAYDGLAATTNGTLPANVSVSIINSTFPYTLTNGTATFAPGV
ncbi:hypothetical protein P7C73_g535, partial [Tremellales sp. Uapishka_1]